MKMRALRFAAGVLAACCAMPVLANDNLIGEYTGTLQKAEGKYRGVPGAPCRVRIEASERYGGSLSFTIDEESPMFFETRGIAAAEAENSSEIKIHTPNTGERIKLKARQDGTPVYILLMKVSSKTHTTDVISCEGLRRK